MDLQPAAQRLDRLGLVLQLLGQFAELLHLAPIDGLEQGLARREVPIERADADTGPSRHGLQARVGAAGAEHRLRRLQHALAVADRVGAGLSNMFGGLICHPIDPICTFLELNRVAISSRCLRMMFQESGLSLFRCYLKRRPPL